MTDKREELIEEAAKALAKAEGIRSWSVMSRTDQKRYGDYAAAVLAVFEKAHAPTDDEREALGTAIWSELAGSDISMNSTFLDRLTRTLVDTVLDSGFRRSVVPEPQGEPSDESIEAAARALGNRHSLGWSYMSEMDRDWERGDARAALRAAGEVK